jgi:hypothetical protein
MDDYGSRRKEEEEACNDKHICTRILHIDKHGARNDVSKSLICTQNILRCVSLLLCGETLSKERKLTDRELPRPHTREESTLNYNEVTTSD